MESDEIDKLLSDIDEKKDRKKLPAFRESLRNSFLDQNFIQKHGRDRLFEWNKRIGAIQTTIEQQQEAEQATKRSQFNLGGNVVAFGFGSSAGKTSNAKKLREQITSCTENDKDRKGLMLAHCLYREFLKEIHDQTKKADTKGPCDNFCEAYNWIWEETGYGLFSHKNANQVTPEVCVTSFLAPLFNTAITSSLDEKEITITSTPMWCSEFTLFQRVKNDDQNNMKDDTANKVMDETSDSTAAAMDKNKKRRREAKTPKEVQIEEDSVTSQREAKGQEGIQKPRTDGLMVLVDPLNKNAVRPLVSMEAKLSQFTQKDDLESVSNACDAFARHPGGEESVPWPLLVFRCSFFGANSCHTRVYALVPTTDRNAKLVQLWSGDRPEQLFHAVVAAAKAGRVFWQHLNDLKEPADFCTVSKNVAFQPSRNEDKVPHKIFKSFYGTKHRNHNLELVQKFIDPKAEVHKLCKPHNVEEDLKKDKQVNWSFLEMKYLGPILPDSGEISVQRLIEVVELLHKLHDDHDMVHGDIRLSNMILSESSGKIIDFDYSGKDGEHKYPPGLVAIADGERHQEVKDAIDNNTIKEQVLRKEHDWHSMKAVMRLFKVKDKEHAAIYDQMINQVMEESAREGNLKHDFLVCFNKPETMTKKSNATGSPMQNQGKG